MRLIDADALMERLKAWDTNDATDKGLYNFALNRVLEAPTIEPERKTGEWIHDGYDIPHGVDWMHCSECGRREPYVPAAMTNFCPNCGADMRG